MDGEGEGIEGFNAYVIIADRCSGGKISNIFKIPVEGICKLEA